jgi:hypothetical protein
MKKKVWKKMKNWKNNLVDDGVPLDLMEMQNLLVSIFRSRSIKIKGFIEVYGELVTKLVHLINLRLKLTEGTNSTNGNIVKGPKRKKNSLRDQYEIKNIFKGPAD